ncbi:hypothetical protein [Tardiphaga sp.]|uniref:hypothetical protein n=1 Tax=Tardiphaga sp. TaxID=1926292 RepID=UPI00352A62FF|nr:hypothetical protein [Hyphomicrobiales bacterium]
MVEVENAEHVIANAIYGAFRNHPAKDERQARLDVLSPDTCVKLAKAVLLDLKAKRLKILPDND